MNIQPQPIVGSIADIQKNFKRILISPQKYYLQNEMILQESCEIYHDKKLSGIIFSFKDYGIRSLMRIGFTLVVETINKKYFFGETFTSISYTNDNQFIIHIIDLQKCIDEEAICSIERCYVVFNWILYHGQEENNTVNDCFEIPDKTSKEYMKKIDDARSCCKTNINTLISDKKAPFPVELLKDAWQFYDEIKYEFEQINNLCNNIESTNFFVDMDKKEKKNQSKIVVPINCYFDKGFYSTVYYAERYPIVEKCFSNGKSAIQCMIAVEESHLDMLLYLYYCTIWQRNYFIFMSDDQLKLEKFLQERHPIMILQKKIRDICKLYRSEEIVVSSTVILRAKQIIKTYFDKLKDIRECAYQNVLRKKQTHGKWVNEYKLFNLIKVIFPDALYQFSDNWLENQILDIYIPSMNLAIEYQGEQHYRSVEYFGGYNKFHEQEKMDSLKRTKCLERGIKLLEWNFEDKILIFNVIDFLKGYVPKKYINIKTIEKNVQSFPIESLSELLFKSEKNEKSKKHLSYKAEKVSKTEIRQYSKDGIYLNSYENVIEAAIKSSLSVGGIKKVIYRERKTAGGFIWKRCDKSEPRVNI